jgi:hypothetical protein
MALRSPIPVPRREDEVARLRPGVPAYSAVLEEAYRLGRADGRLAAAVDDGPPDPSSPTCRGRLAAEFAEHLWADLPGDPPSGVEVNARTWYLTGLAEGLVEGVAEARS